MFVTRLDEQAVVEMLPGQHVVVLSDDPVYAIEGRRLGLELRDTLLVLSAGRAEFAFLFRKELEGTVAENVLRYGQGGLNIEGCRISYGTDQPSQEVWNSKGSGGHSSHFDQMRGGLREAYRGGMITVPTGRWPTNLVLIHGPACRLTREVWDCQGGCPVVALDRQSGEIRVPGSYPSADRGVDKFRNKYGGNLPQPDVHVGYGDTGGASRFFPQFASVSEFEAWTVRLTGSQS